MKDIFGFQSVILIKVNEVSQMAFIHTLLLLFL